MPAIDHIPLFCYEKRGLRFRAETLFTPVLNVNKAYGMLRSAFAALVIFLLILQPVTAVEQVPFGDKVSKNIVNYHRHTPHIATSGKLLSGAIGELKQHGFKTVLDMRTAKEGTKEEEIGVREAGIQYYNIPIPKGWPQADAFVRFRAIIENQENHPILIHCASANRVGMMWSAYQLENGVEYEQAILEGRTIGMKLKREKQLTKNYEAK
ncbi:MAG: hypothetical protein ACI92E_002935 [Oceanicoccus sp.]|jgi:uncharacterized protein (TIGR01244 family)